MLSGLLKGEQVRIVASLAMFVMLATISFNVHSQSSPPYSVHWINPLRVNINGSILTKGQYPNTWIAGAISSNLLDPNTDGWMEFTSVAGAHYILGLAYNNIYDVDQFSNAIFIDQANNYYAAYEGTTITGLGACQIGDVFKIAREGNVVNYYRNDVVVRTVTVNPATVLQIKASIRYAGKSTPLINASFDGRLILQGGVNGLENDSETGGIAVSVSGGTSPYTYNWSSGEQGNSISNKTFGTYAVTVSDGAGRTRDRVYGLGYDVHWINPIGVSMTGNILRKTASTSVWTNAGAISSNLLPPNTDGWIEFEGSYDAYYMVGLTVNDVIDFDKFAHAIRIDYSANGYTMFEGTTGAGFRPWQTGDVFRISREGDLVKYYHNGTVVRTVTVNPSLSLKVKTSIRYAGKTTPNINLSFGNRMVLQGSVTGLADNNGSGNISFAASGGTPPYAYNWSSGEQTSSLVDKQRNSYTVNVSDAAGRSESRTYNLGYKVNWINEIGGYIVDGILTKTVIGAVWYNAGAVSSNILAANTDGWMEFSTSNTDDYMVGLAVNNTIDSDEFNHAVKLDHLANTYVLFSGASGVGSGTWQTGDVFRISREGSLVHYFKNDVVIKTVNVNSALVLKVKASIRHRYKRTPIINASFWATDGIVRTYYSIANGNWTDPSIWSLTENGPPSTVYPDDIDKVVIKGHEVTVDSSIKSAGITITAINDNTSLKVDGSMGALTVKGNILMNRESSPNTAEVLMVQNNGKLDVKNQ